MTDPSPGRLYVVATPIGNLEDLTFRAARILGEADILAAEDTRSVRVLLDRHGITAQKIVSYFAGNEAQRTDELAEALVAGQSVAIVSEAGTPAVSDPGFRLVARARELGLRVEVIPGPSAALTALVGSGLPTERFTFLGFPPRVEGARRRLFAEVRHAAATLIFYESPERVGATLADLASALGADRRATLARELTKLHEELVHGTLGELAERYGETPPRGECSLVVEGAPEGAAAGEVDVEGAVRGLLEQGLGPRDVAARLVVATGKPRRQLYQLALSLMREREDAT